MFSINEKDYFVPTETENVCLSKKRQRNNSFDNFLSIFEKEKKNFDDVEILNSFNCSFKNVRDDFEEENYYKSDIFVDMSINNVSLF